jgi:CBS domain-containing protein
MGSVLDSLVLVRASVPRSATVADASRLLVQHGLSAVAVVDEAERVVGFFTEDELLRALFPGYLGELRHTAFLPEDLDELLSHAQGSGSRPVAARLSRAVIVERGDATAHLAECFLHSEWGAVAVVEKGRFVGMVRQLDFCQLLIERSRY